MVAIMIVGLFVGSVNRTVGISLFLIGCVGFLGGGVAIYLAYPRRLRKD